MADEIVVSITSQDMLILKQHCQTIIDAYKKHCAELVRTDENAIFPILSDPAINLKSDAIAGIDAIDSYQNVDMSQIKRPKKDPLEISSYGDINTLSGNYPITQSLYDEAKDSAGTILKGLKGREVNTGNDGIGSDFSDGEGSRESVSNPEVEKINSVSQKRAMPKSSTKKEKIKSDITAKVYNGNKKGRYRNVISEDCIPCEFRLGSASDIQVNAQLINPLEEMVEKYNQLTDQMNYLFHNTEILDDLCSLLGFLNSQCVPDLFAIIALLNAMLNRTLGASFNVDGMFMMFIGPFFTPLLSGLTGILDQYMQAIMQPIDCVLSALDTQLAKLDISKAVDQAKIKNVAEHRRREGYLRRKKEELIQRESFLKDAKKIYGGGSYPPRKIGGIRSDGSADAIDVTASLNKTKPIYATIDQELAQIRKDISKIDSEYSSKYGPAGKYNISKMMKEIKDPYQSTARKFMELPGRGRNALQNMNKSLSSGLHELRIQILNGKKMVKDSLELISDELRRLILGRAATSEEAFAGILEIQKIIRLISLVETLIQMAAQKSKCNDNNDPAAIVGSYLAANSGKNGKKGQHTVLEAEDEDGEKYLIVAPPDSTVKLIGPEGSIKQSYETSEAERMNAKSIGQKIEYSPNEVAEMNSNGIIPNIGNIATKKVVASVPELDVDVELTPVRMDCGRNDTDESILAEIKSWAVNAGL